MQEKCSFIGCGRTKKAHCREHFSDEKHGLCINVHTGEIWCYLCDTSFVFEYSAHSNARDILKTMVGPLLRIRDDSSSPDSGHFIPGICGLGNIGNTCYMNSVIQAMAACYPLTIYLRDLDLFHEAKKSTILYEYINLLDDLFSGKYTYAIPRELRRSIALKNRQFASYNQQDAQELLRTVVDNIEESLKIQIYGGPIDVLGPIENSSTVTLSDSTSSTSSSEGHIPSSKNYYSVVRSIFGGILHSDVCCLECNNVSMSRELFYDVSLSIPNEDLRNRIYQKQIETQSNRTIEKDVKLYKSIGIFFGITSREYHLDDLFEGFCLEENLDYKLTCSKCKVPTSSEKKFSFHELPDVLTIHIKRFKHDSFFSSKISDTVKFPEKDLDLSRFLTDENESARYDLLSVINHQGSFYGGHYVSYCKNYHNNKWYLFNDKYVKEVSVDDVLNAEAYLLFYKRRVSYPDDNVIRSIRDRISKEEIDVIDDVLFISKVWNYKWNFLHDPGPITNYEIQCEHGKIRRDIENPLTRVKIISREVGTELENLYGGACIQDIKQCNECVDPRELGERRNREKLGVTKIDRIEVTKDDSWYILDTRWINQWRDFITNNGDPPGEISNHRLFLKNGNLKKNLKKNIHYRGVNKLVWKYLVEIYGGGPEIVRKELNIYRNL
eukprot:TRINITY_DN2157_c0_g1_i2.p1 TRINITY_DN2157_c0_g1~~TRINITY_DN2157_c0_g1_i2.p1  ORF type:complete len:666 (-),score=107.14 TRINITY_DN2157_c0_g1_i2:11-2008(-)